MPRKHTPARKARAELLAIKLEKARYEIRALRRTKREAEAALALRKSNSDWVEMNQKLKQLHLEAELDAMEACIDERRPKIPILNFDLMPGFSPPKSQKPAKQEPTVHPDVLIQAELTAAEARRSSANENSPPPPGGKIWKYDSTLEGRRPEDDWRNWE